VVTAEFNLSKKINKELLLAIAFECLIASAECLLIHEIQSKTKFSINAIDIVLLRTTNSGDVDEMYSILRKSFNFLHLLTADLPSDDHLECLLSNH
jgi:hypothetical protein